MSKIPQTNVVGVFNDPVAAAAAAKDLRADGFGKDKVGIMPQGSQTTVTVQADGRHAEASASLEEGGAADVQNVAR